MFNADIAEAKVVFIPEADSEVNPLGIKGLGELGNVGTNAAVGNAVFHATGMRIRELPIHLEKLLAAAGSHLAGEKSLSATLWRARKNKD